MIYTVTLNPAVDWELTVPTVRFDAVLQATGSRTDLGGKGFNVSRLLKCMGMPSTAMGFVGGSAGQRLEDGLKSLGIATDFVWVPEETRTNVSIVTESHDRYVKVNDRGPTVDEARQGELLDKIRSIAKADDWWVLAGSLPPGVPDDFYARITNILTERQAITILDTIGESLRLGCGALPFLVKPNAEEAAQLTGLRVEDTAQVVAAEEIMRMGAQNVVISLGKQGALLHTPDGTWLVHSPRIHEKNPIGAGDAMVGGLVWGLARGHSLKEALGWGAASGAATASTPGTEIGSRELIEELFQKVEYEAL